MTALPDWLVERVALDEVSPPLRDRVARLDPADAAELATRVAALRADNAAELAAYPARPAVAQIESRVAAANKKQRARRMQLLGAVAGAASLAVVATLVLRDDPAPPAALPDDVVAAADPVATTPDDGIRVKGATRLVVFRQAGDKPQKLADDDLVRSGDVLQLRYNAGGRRYGVIASIDGAQVVTLHYPANADAPPAATALAAKPTALPNAYALDDAPKFERFFFITADAPIDVGQTLASLRTLAEREDSATATPALPDSVHQWSLRLRKPEATTP